MQALGATLITVVAIVLCVRILRGRKRWKVLCSNGLSRRMGSLSSFPGFSSGLGEYFPLHFASTLCMQSGLQELTLSTCSIAVGKVLCMRLL